MQKPPAPGRTAVLKADRVPIDVLIDPFTRFSGMEASGGILLLAATVIALAWANSPWEHGYHAIWEREVTAGLGRTVLTWSRHLWVNDGLMSVFFFLVGLEIKRELLIGELSSFKRAAFPFVAALGGCLLPAALYLAVNHGTPEAHAWGIPMATDIAFALGVLALLGNRVPASLKLFVAALAIADDIVAVLVIAIFYTARLNFFYLGLGAIGLVISYAANKAGIRSPWVYGFIGVLVWFAVMQSGVHATIAGVLLAFTIPYKSSTDKQGFVAKVQRLLERFEAAEGDSTEAQAALDAMEEQCARMESTLNRIEHGLQPWVSFVIMPLFAFSNAGVHVLGNLVAAAKNPVTLGVGVGLVIGKPFGITAFAWAAERTKLAARPAGVSWMQIFAAAWVCGIGFTMSLFIATLALHQGGPLDLAKIGTLGASVVAGCIGCVLLLRSSQRSEQQI
ncbi:MAG TPA: Na+/H+ antiporter NhaA [Edaphobacter sp.]|jgi:NhaA family Na+:H+ antiporter|nr:Na+/H+ antiporter NhaA [Edaphobacter sp.]